MTAPCASGDSVTEFRAALQCLVCARRGLRGAYVTVFGLSLILRILLATAVRPILISDARDYHVLAQNLAEGRGYFQVYQGETRAFDGFTFRAFRSPGYPFVLAVLYRLFGWQASVYLGLNIVADVVTQACALLIAAYLFGAGPALLVQFLLAIHVLWTPNPMTEALHTALMTLLALLLVTRVPLRTWPGALGFGLLTAAALLVRPITLCVFPAVAWRCLGSNSNRRRLPLLGLVVLPSVITVAAWAVRNHALFGQYVLFTTNFGHHNAAAYGIPADEFFARYRRQGLNEAEINHALIRLEWNVAKADPIGWLLLWARQTGELFSLSPPWEVKTILWNLMLPTGTGAPWINRLYRASYNQYYVTYALFACGSIFLLLRRESLGGLWILMLSYVVLHAALSRGDMRLLAPLYPILSLLAAGLWARVSVTLSARGQLLPPLPPGANESLESRRTARIRAGASRLPATAAQVSG